MPKKKQKEIVPKLFKNDDITNEFAELIDDKLTSPTPPNFILLTPSAGIGKTFITIHSIGLLPGGKNAHFMIFGPKAKTLDGSWESSIEGYNIVNNTQMTYTLNTQNYIKDHYDEVIKIIDEKTNLQQPVIVVIDEVHLAKNPTSKIGKAVNKLVHETNVLVTIGLSATPYTDSYIDTIGYLVWNDYYRNKTEFLHEQVKMFDDYFQPVVKNNQNEIDRNLFNDPDKLDEYLAEFQIDKSQHSNRLPPISFKEIRFDLDQNQKIKYIDPFFAAFKNVKPRTQRGNYNAVRNKYYREGYYESASEAITIQRKMITNILQRINCLTDVLLSIRQSNDAHPVLIFYQYNIELDAITNAIERHPILKDTTINIVNGKRKDLSDTTDPKTVYIIQYKAGGAAIEFKHAYSSIYFMPTYQYGTYLQTLGRNRRAGMTHPITYYKLICNNTLDSYIWDEVLENKKSFTNKTMDKVITMIEE